MALRRRAASGSNGAGYLCGAGGCSRVPTAGLRWRALLATAARRAAAPASTRAVLTLAAMESKIGGKRAERRCRARKRAGVWVRSRLPVDYRGAS